MTLMELYNKLKSALRKEIESNNLSGRKVSVKCRSLSTVEAIGRPEDEDYPIVRGKEKLVEAVFEGVRGQAFTDEFENAQYSVEELLEIKLDSNKKRASFISSLNALFRYLNLCDKTVHCKDTEPKECAKNLINIITPNSKVFFVGFQPRFLEILAPNYNVRAVDLDQENIGREILDVVIEPPEMTIEAIRWCDLILATGSTVVNGTITDFLNHNKPVLFYGVTISATAKILNLDNYCYCGH